MIYEDGKRFYIIEGEKLPSVNTVLTVLPFSREIIAWRERTANWEEIQEYRKLQGTMIHYQIACFIAQKAGLPPPELPLRIDEKRLLQAIFQEKDKRDRFNQEVQFAVAMFQDWDLEYSPQYIDAEMVVYSKEIKFAGTTDIYCIITKHYWLIDIKSNPYIFDKYEYQLGGYWIAAREMGKRVDRIGLLNISPTLRTRKGYNFTRLGDSTRDFLKARRKFTHHHAI